MPTVIQIIMQVVLIGLSVFGISSLMELYKTKVRKGKAGKWELRGIAAVLSLGTAAVFWKVGFVGHLFDEPYAATTKQLVTAAVYAVVIFVLQLNADMKLLKTIVKAATDMFPTGEEILTDEIKELLDKFQSNTKVSLTKIVNFFIKLGISEDKFKEILKNIGMEDCKVDELIAAYKKAAAKKEAAAN